MNPKDLRNAVYLWLYVMINYFPYRINPGNTSDTNVAVNMAKIKLELANAQIVISDADLSSHVKTILGANNTAAISNVADVFMNSPTLYNGWSGAPRHPATNELDSIFIPK